MKKKTCKILICIGLFMLLFTNITSIYGATNPEYTPKVEVSENALDSKIKDNVLLDVLAGMINALASLAEYIIGDLFNSLTKENIFPWADRIIFNGIGFLDINFMNPASNSLFVKNGADSILGKVIKNVYSTIFSLAVLFLGVAVGIMAIRLAISTIASEKAKYKQAIVNWLTCIVMLFMMHYILSFVFWVNEQMVRIASGILIDTIEDKDVGISEVDFSQALNTVLTPQERVDKYIEQSNGGVDEVVRTNISNHADIANIFLTNDNYVKDRLIYYSQKTNDLGENLIQFVFQADDKMGISRLNADITTAAGLKLLDKEKLKSDMSKNGYVNEPITNTNIWSKNAADKYKASADYLNDLRLTACYAGMVNAGKNNEVVQEILDNPKEKIIVYGDVNSLTTALGVINIFSNTSEARKNLTKSKEELEEALGKSTVDKIVNYRLKCDGYIWENAMEGQIGKSSTKDLIANLAGFFKKTAYVYETDDAGEVMGWKATKVSVTGALLYAIFIFQSMIYLIMYVKRLFYVIMLSMFGPIVVIYDFFIKSAT